MISGVECQSFSMALQVVAMAHDEDELVDQSMVQALSFTGCLSLEVMCRCGSYFILSAPGLEFLCKASEL